MNHDELLRRDSKRFEKQETLHDGMLSKIAQAEAALHDVGGEKHEVLFVGEDVVNCRKLAGRINMHPGFSCQYEQYGEKVNPDIDTVVLSTYNPEVLARVKPLVGERRVVIMMNGHPPPDEVKEQFPDHFVAASETGAFGLIINPEPAATA
jgi:hypothetical protein